MMIPEMMIVVSDCELQDHPRAGLHAGRVSVLQADYLQQRHSELNGHRQGDATAEYRLRKPREIAGISLNYYYARPRLTVGA